MCKIHLINKCKTDNSTSLEFLSVQNTIYIYIYTYKELDIRMLCRNMALRGKADIKQRRTEQIQAPPV